MEKRERKIFWTALLALTLAGGIARVVGCFWGYPLLLHPDESATVDYAIDMLSRHSWMAASFDRPDHFEIKPFCLPSFPDSATGCRPIRRFQSI